MDEKAILSLISHAVRQILREYGAGWNDIDEARIGDHIADVAWTALIVGARELLARGQPVILEEFGRFEVVDGSWRFDAAESLQEAKSLSLSPNQGNHFLAEHALYFLSRATELARQVPADTRVIERGVSDEHKNFYANFEQEEVLFGVVIRARARRLMELQVHNTEQTYSHLLDIVESVSESLEVRAINPEDLNVAFDEIKVGRVYEGTVKALLDFGAIIELIPGHDGLLRISDITDGPVRAVSDHLKKGQKVTVKVLAIDERGRIRLSMKAVARTSWHQSPDVSAS